MNFYNVPLTWTAAEVHTDLQAGRYLVMGLYNESRPHDFNLKRTEADFTADALRARRRALMTCLSARAGVAGRRCRAGAAVAGR